MNCREYLERELALLSQRTVLVALGALAFAACLKILLRAGVERPRPLPRFAHGAVYPIGTYKLLASYHPSRQNTNTGKLTREMWYDVFRKARASLEEGATGSRTPR